VRLVVVAAVILTVAACSDSNTGPGGTKPPTTSFDTLGSGSIAPSGGTITVNKSGDPLNGLTLTVPSGAFSSTLDITIGSTSNKNLPSANGIVPISPLVHVVTSAGGYANGAITFRIPATVPANTFPVVVLYDSATGALENMTTIAFDGSSVTAITGHLSQPTIPSASASRVSGRRIGAAAASSSGPDSLFVAFGVFAIPYTTLNQDWDTHFRPGTNDWEMPSIPTEAVPGGALLGVAATELWYFNSQASTTPLNGRFAAVRNAPLSDTIGFHWTSQVDNQVSNQVNSFLSSAYKSVTSGQAGADSLQFNNIRAGFAIPTLNAGKPLPVLVDLQSSAHDFFYYLIAYRATGNQIYVADPVSPGDNGLFLQLASSGMTPYANPSYKSGVSLVSPLSTPLGLAVALPALASSYGNAVAGTVGTSLFPTSAFYSWAGQLYDTMYVVDTLRFWAQCATCQFGFTSTLSPPPSGNVEASINVYNMLSGLVTDSVGSLSSDGLLVTQANLAPGEQRVVGVPIASAAAAGTPSSGSSARRWLDWHQFTLTNLQGTVTLPTSGSLVNDPDTLQVSFKPDLVPANVAYQWSFGDSTPMATLQNNATVIHSYTKTGTFPITVKVIDNRNGQVIARADTTLNGANVELWVIQSLTFLYATINGARSDTAPPKLSLPITAGTVPTLIAINGPPFPGGDYDEAGFGFVAPTDSAQQWAQFHPIGLAISGPHTPFDVFSYSNTGTATSGTITGKALESHTGVLTNSGRSVNLTKNGSKLSGYIMVQSTGLLNGVQTTGIEYDSVVATRVRP
jgi:PKD domain